MYADKVETEIAEFEISWVSTRSNLCQLSASLGGQFARNIKQRKTQLFILKVHVLGSDGKEYYFASLRFFESPFFRTIIDQA